MNASGLEAVAPAAGGPGSPSPPEPAFMSAGHGRSIRLSVLSGPSR